MEAREKDKHKGGRPRKGITQRKQRIVSIRFSNVEYYAIKRRASLARMTVSAYSHSAIIDGKVVGPMKKEDMDLLRKLSGETNNLNRIARQANTYRMPYLEKEVKNVLNLVTETINKLSDDWKIIKGKSFSGCISYVLGKVDAKLLDSEGVLLNDTQSISTASTCRA